MAQPTAAGRQARALTATVGIRTNASALLSTLRGGARWARGWRRRGCFRLFAGQRYAALLALDLHRVKNLILGIFLKNELYPSIQGDEFLKAAVRLAREFEILRQIALHRSQTLGSSLFLRAC